MASGPKIPTDALFVSRRFAIRLGLFYAAVFALMGVHLPFFPVWLQAVGVSPVWIGLIVATPSLVRFTILPVVTGLAERRQSLRQALIATALLTAVGFAGVGLFHAPMIILIVFALTACAWTPILPLTDAYALQGVARHRLHYGPLRLWGSAAFMAGTLGCGMLADRLAATHLIWIMAGLAILGAATAFALQPMTVPEPMTPARTGARHLLRQPAYLAVIAAAALIQGSHAAYYGFASIAWQATGLGGTTIAGLWTLGVLAEIAIFALSPRFRAPPALLIVIGGFGATFRWLVMAAEPSLAPLATVQLLHGVTYGLTLLGTMGLLVRIVPVHAMASAQGYLAAASGIVMSGASILAGAMYARLGADIYHAMAMMAAGGVIVIWLARRSIARDAESQPQSAASGG